MKLAHPAMDSVIDLDKGLPTLVIESQLFFRGLLADIAAQIDGRRGDTVLSEHDEPIDMYRGAELLEGLTTFTVNTRSLQSKILSAMEKTAAQAPYHLEGIELLQRMEQYVLRLTQDCTADIICGKLTMSAVLKAIGITVSDDYADPLERFLDYMELVRE